MSLDLFVHCKSSTPLSAEQLSAALTSHKIGSAIFEDSIKYTPVVSGPFRSCTILGWKHESFDSARLTEILSRGDEKQLAHLFANGVVAYANVAAMDATEYYGSFGDDYPASLAGEIDQYVLEFMKSSSTVYEVQTSAGRSDLSWQFQMAVCSVIAELSEGLIEEPQMGEYFFACDAEKHFPQF